MSFKRALEVLKSLPPEEQVLAAGVYKFYDGDKAVCGCAVGKILPTFYTEIGPKDSIISEGTNDLMDYLQGSAEMMQELHDLDLSYGELDDLQNENDQFMGRDWMSVNGRNRDEDNSEQARKERYKHVIKWLEEQIALKE